MDNKAVSEYINEFKFYLKQLSKTDQDDVLEFYREYIIDAKLTTQDEIINELGTPKNLARKVLADYSIKMSENNYQNIDDGKISDNQKMKRNLGMIGLIVLALFASPVLIPAAIALVGVLILFAAAAIGIGLGFVFIVALSVVVGIAFIVVGLSVIFQSFLTTLLYIGAGLFILGVDFVLIPLIISFFKWIFDLLVMFFRWVGKKLLHGRNTPKKGDQTNA